MSFGARAVIRPDALRHNLQTLRQCVPGARVMAVIKANAYGHGLAPVAAALDDADAFAVARLEEALRLRDSGIDKPVVLLEGVWDAGDQATAIEQGCELVVHCEEQLGLLAAQPGGRVNVWLKVDTGMARLGLLPQDVAPALARLRALDCVRDVRLMTHFSSADELDNPRTLEQLECFRHIAKDFAGDISVANSPAILGWPQVRTLAEDLGIGGAQWLRPGIALYGISAFADRTGSAFGLEPVMRFEGRLIAMRKVGKGAPVGYKQRFHATRDTTIGVIAAGYGDGYSRGFADGTPVLLNGRRVPLAGIVSMDMITVDLGPDARDRIGDVATLWGPGLPVEELAEFCDSIPYTLVCGVMHRDLEAPAIRP